MVSSDNRIIRLSGWIRKHGISKLLILFQSKYLVSGTEPFTTCRFERYFSLPTKDENIHQSSNPSRYSQHRFDDYSGHSEWPWIDFFQWQSVSRQSLTSVLLVETLSLFLQMDFQFQCHCLLGWSAKETSQSNEPELFQSHLDGLVIFVTHQAKGTVTLNPDHVLSKQFQLLARE